MKDKRFKPIPAPTGNFIIHSRVPYFQTDNGAYYHYVHVVSLLNKMAMLEQLRAYRVVYWRNVFEIYALREIKEKDQKANIIQAENALDSCNHDILTHIRELQNQIYPPQINKQ